MRAHIIQKMSRSRIIAFAGRKRAGKDMLAKAIQMREPNTVILAVADNLKELCAELLNVTIERLNQMKDDSTTFKEKVDGRWVSIINNRTGISDEIIYGEIGGWVFQTVREVLQVIGTDLIRKYVPEWHIDKTIEKILSIGDDKIIVVDDVRFPNEKCKIEEVGGEVFFVMRPNFFDISNHPSETALQYNDFPTDRVIINDLPKEKMEDEIQKFYFDDYQSPIFLSENPWYLEHSINMQRCYTQSKIDGRNIVKLVIDHNRNMPQFINNGIITFQSNDPYVLYVFRQIIMNDARGSDGCKSYSFYNPITNEMIKLFMG